MAQQEDTWPLERQKLKARLLSRVRHWSAGVPLGRYFLVALRHLQEKTFTNDMRQCSPKCRQIKKIPRSDGQMSLAGAPSKKKKNLSTSTVIALFSSLKTSSLPIVGRIWQESATLKILHGLRILALASEQSSLDLSTF